jgi:hypothetical protein
MKRMTVAPKHVWDNWVTCWFVLTASITMIGAAAFEIWRAVDALKKRWPRQTAAFFHFAATSRMGLGFGVIGILGIWWGWRNDRHGILGPVSLVGGSVLWVYACFVLLPWSGHIIW